jgi:hypothetical protein
MRMLSMKRGARSEEGEAERKETPYRTSAHLFSKILTVGTPSNFPAHATMLVKDSLDWTFSLPHFGHFTFIRGS